MKFCQVFATATVVLAGCWPTNICYRDQQCAMQGDTGAIDAVTGPDVVARPDSVTPDSETPDAMSQPDAVVDVVIAPPTVVAISVGGLATCATQDRDGRRRTFCWGKDNNGTLGHSTLMNVATPRLSDRLSNVTIPDTIDIRVGMDHGCRTINNGGGSIVQCWGSNTLSQLSTALDSAPHPDPSAVFSMPSALTLPRSSGFSTGSNHTCAINNDDQVVCWGDNSAGQCGANLVTMATKTNANAVAGVTSTRFEHIAAGSEHTCASGREMGDGGQVTRLYCWGDPSNGKTGLTDAQATATRVAGSTHVPVSVDVSEPANRGFREIIDVTVGANHTCFIASKDGGADTELYCFGANNSGQIGQPVAMSMFHQPQLIALTHMSVVYRARRVDAGSNFTCVLAENTRIAGNTAVFCWGDNSGFALAQGTTTILNPTPLIVEGLTKPTFLSAGGTSACVIDTGTIRCWGNNASGQLGDGTMDARSMPVEITLPSS